MRTLLFLGLLTLLNSRAAEMPAISVVREAGHTKVTFAGTLQASSAVTGPWIELTNAISPYFEAESDRRFFRARASESIFAAQSVAEFTVIGPLQEHFELAFAGLPDGIFPPVREKPWFEGSLQIEGRTIPATLRVRGNSSLQECPFPKLKFKVSRDDRAGTSFFDAREVKIGTHCAEGGRGSIGRLREEKAAYREALAYEIMHVLGFTGPRVRRARIQYRDISPVMEGREAGWDLTRMAIIFDDPEVVAERLGGRALDDEEVGALTNASFKAQLILDLHLLHVLLGNWDYGLSEDGRNLWNTEVLELADRTLVPMAGDFDLASIVTENVQDDAPWDYFPELPPLERRARFKIAEALKEASLEQAEQAKSRFLQKRAALESLAASALLDEAGRTNAQAHLEAFFTALNGKEGPKDEETPRR